MGYDPNGFVWVTVWLNGGVIVTSKAGFCLVWSTEKSVIAWNYQFRGYIFSLAENCSTEVVILLVSLDSSFPILESESILPEFWYILVQQGEYLNFALEITQIFLSTFLRPL